jgi:hypothetical protein
MGTSTISVSTIGAAMDKGVGDEGVTIAITPTRRAPIMIPTSAAWKSVAVVRDIGDGGGGLWFGGGLGIGH